MTPTTLPAGKAPCTDDRFSFPESLKKSMIITKEQIVLEVVVAHYGLKLPYQTLLSLRAINRRMVSTIDESVLLPHAFCQERRLSSATLAMYSMAHYHSHIRTWLARCVNDDGLREFDRLSSLNSGDASQPLAEGRENIFGTDKALTDELVAPGSASSDVIYKHTSFSKRLAWWCSLLRLHHGVRFERCAYEALGQNERVNYVSFVSNKPYLLVATDSIKYRLYQYEFEKAIWVNTSTVTLDEPAPERLIYSHDRRFMAGRTQPEHGDDILPPLNSCFLLSVDDGGKLNLTKLIGVDLGDVTHFCFSQCDRFLTVDLRRGIDIKSPVGFYLYRIQPEVECIVKEEKGGYYKTIGFSPADFCCVMQYCGTGCLDIKCWDKQCQLSSVVSFDYHESFRHYHLSKNNTVLANIISTKINLVFYSGCEWISSELIDYKYRSAFPERPASFKLSPDAKTIVVLFHSYFEIFDINYSSLGFSVSRSVSQSFLYRAPQFYSVIFSHDCNNLLTNSLSEDDYRCDFFSHYTRHGQQWKKLKDYDHMHLANPTFSPDSNSLALIGCSHEFMSSKLLAYSKQMRGTWSFNDVTDECRLGYLRKEISDLSFSEDGLFMAFSAGYPEIRKREKFLVLYRIVLDS